MCVLPIIYLGRFEHGMWALCDTCHRSDLVVLLFSVVSWGCNFVPVIISTVLVMNSLVIQGDLTFHSPLSSNLFSIFYYFFPQTVVDTRNPAFTHLIMRQQITLSSYASRAGKPPHHGMAQFMEGTKRRLSNLTFTKLTYEVRLICWLQATFKWNAHLVRFLLSNIF